MCLGWELEALKQQKRDHRMARPWTPTVEHVSPSFVTHDMPCPVCLEFHATYYDGSSTPIFGPCNECLEKGWHLVNFKPGRISRLLNPRQWSRAIANLWRKLC